MARLDLTPRGRPRSHRDLLACVIASAIVCMGGFGVHAQTREDDTKKLEQLQREYKALCVGEWENATHERTCKRLWNEVKQQQARVRGARAGEGGTPPAKPAVAPTIKRATPAPTPPAPTGKAARPQGAAAPKPAESSRSFMVVGSCPGYGQFLYDRRKPFRCGGNSDLPLPSSAAGGGGTKPVAGACTITGSC